MAIPCKLTVSLAIPSHEAKKVVKEKVAIGPLVSAANEIRFWFRDPRRRVTDMGGGVIELSTEDNRHLMARKVSQRRHTRDSAKRLSAGTAQLGLVEHALCPLDSSVSLRGNLVHTCQHYYTDANRHRKRATVRVGCPEGLSAGDELFLWGLLALTFSQAEPSLEFYATPHYCLRRLDSIDSHAKRGGRQYEQFRQAIRRLAGVYYQNDAFYDPTRAEHREVGFGLLSYSLPLDPKSARGWRILWDPLFFEYCQANSGHFAFDLQTYRRLDCASRRLFLLLKKMFHRRQASVVLDLRHAAVNVMGYSANLSINDLKKKLIRCSKRLVEAKILAPHAEGHGTVPRFEKCCVGQYKVRFSRGAYFDDQQVTKQGETDEECSLAEPLASIGFDERAIRRFTRQFPTGLLAEWVDITLAARERFGEEFFKRSPAAYFTDNVKAAALGQRTPPDWWLDVRKEEQRRVETDTVRALGLFDASDDTDDVRARFRDYLRDAGRRQYEELSADIFRQLRSAGRDATDARRAAHRHAKDHLWRQFNSQKRANLVSRRR